MATPPLPRVCLLSQLYSNGAAGPLYHPPRNSSSSSSVAAVAQGVFSASQQLDGMSGRPIGDVTYLDEDAQQQAMELALHYAQTDLDSAMVASEASNEEGEDFELNGEDAGLEEEEIAAYENGLDGASYEEDEDVALEGEASAVAEGDPDYPPLIQSALLIQIAAQTGDLARLKILLQLEETPSEKSVITAFVVAARHGNTNILEYLCETFKISANCFICALLEAMEGRWPVKTLYIWTQNDFFSRDPDYKHLKHSDANMGIADRLNHEENLKAIHYLFSLAEKEGHPINEWESVAQRIGWSGDQGIFRSLCDTGKMSLELRKVVSEGAMETVVGDRLQRDCLTYALNSQEERSWALDRAALLVDETESLEILLGMYPFSKEERFSACEYANDGVSEPSNIDNLVAALTLGLPDTERYWALHVAMPYVGEWGDQGDNNPSNIILSLLQSFQAADMLKRQEDRLPNLGLSDDEIKSLLVDAYRIEYPEIAKETISAFFRFCNVSDQVIQEAIKILSTDAPATLETEEDVEAAFEHLFSLRNELEPE